MSLASVPSMPSSAPPEKASALACENGRHSAVGGSRTEINGISHAVCRHCGCELMRFGSSRRWFRTGRMGG